MLVEDLGSTNGTRVDGEHIARTTELKDGSKLHLGDVALRFQLMDPEDLAFQADLARQVRTASRDPLTQLLTRRYLDKRLPGILSRHRLNDAPLSLLMLDLDRFKRVNDRFGHLTGDEVLRGAAEVIQSCIRGADAAIRYGGEEVCVVLPGAEIKRAAEVAERIRHSIEVARFSERQPDLQVTASLGVAQADEDEDAQRCLARADAALYRAKEQGRNQVELAPFEEPDVSLGTVRGVDTSWEF